MSFFNSKQLHHNTEYLVNESSNQKVFLSVMGECHTVCEIIALVYCSPCKKSSLQFLRNFMVL